MKGSIATLILASLCASPVSAEQSQARFSVGVTVPKHATLEVIEQPAELSLTAQDIARGYKDVITRYLVRHNDRHGYLLQIAPHVGVAQRIEVRGLGADVILRDDVVDIHRAGETFVQDLALEFHIVLDASSRPGTIALPVHVAVTTL